MVLAALLPLGLAACTRMPAPEIVDTARACRPVAEGVGATADSAKSARLEPYFLPFNERVNRLPGFSAH